MSYYTEFEDALKQSCDLIFPDLPPGNVIFSDQDGAEPKGTYIDINVITLDQTGMASTPTLTNEAQKLLINANYEGLVRFIFTGKDSDSLASEFHFALDNIFFWEQIRAKNLGIMRKGTVKRIPDKRETTIIKRFSLDVTFSFAVETEQYVNIIERITFSDDSLTGSFTIP